MLCHYSIIFSRFIKYPVFRALPLSYLVWSLSPILFQFGCPSLMETWASVSLKKKKKDVLLPVFFKELSAVKALSIVLVEGICSSFQGAGHGRRKLVVIFPLLRYSCVFVAVGFFTIAACEVPEYILHFCRIWDCGYWTLFTIEFLIFIGDSLCSWSPVMMTMNWMGCTGGFGLSFVFSSIEDVKHNCRRVSMRCHSCAKLHPRMPSGPFAVFYWVLEVVLLTIDVIGNESSRNRYVIAFHSCITPSLLLVIWHTRLGSRLIYRLEYLIKTGISILCCVSEISVKVAVCLQKYYWGVGCLFKWCKYLDTMSSADVPITRN